ncbi:MAG: thioesterase family protein [Bacteroidota bacterium]|nr:thioesterase family protein [Bacteroidota bacterium]
MSHTVPVNIRYSDIDINNHVNNAVYFTYMENARTELLVNDLVEYQKNNIVFIVSEASCKYKQPILLTDNVICELKFELLTPLRIGVTYLFKNADTSKLYAEGKTTLVMLSNNTNKPVQIPDELINRLIQDHGD